ncbi:MAG: hypothetical protein AB9903_28860 [Vulcanimicrobiota bacterium]
MDNLRFHVMPDSEISAVVLHRSHHPLYGLTRENVYPEESRQSFTDLITTLRGRSPLSSFLPPPCAYDHLYWQQNLYIEERNGRYIILEPDSAGLMVLDERMWHLFRLMERPVPYRYIVHNYLAPVGVTDSFIEECRCRNLLCLENSPAIFEHPFCEPPSVFAAAVLKPSQPGFENAVSLSPDSEVLIDKLLHEILPEKAGELPAVEIFSENKEMESVIPLISHLRGVQGYESCPVMLHTPLESAESALAAFLAWNGVVVRAYSSSIEELMADSSSSREKLHILLENQVLESLSLAVQKSSDCDVIETMMRRDSVPEVRVCLSLPEVRVYPSLPEVGVYPGFPEALGQAGDTGQDRVKEIAEALVAILERLPIEARFRVFPVNYIFERLLHSRCDSPCTQRGLGHSTARVFFSFGGAVAICESSRLNGAHFNRTCSDEYYRNDGWRCTSINEECAPCQGRGICPGRCTAVLNRFGRTDDKSICDFYRALIPELVVKSSEWPACTTV